MKKLFALLLALALALLCCAALGESAEPYQIEGTKLVKYLGAETVATVPDGVETIGEYAFMGVESVQEIVLPASLKTVEMSAFNGCTNLSRLEIPAGVEELGLGFASECPSLQAIGVAASNAAYTAVDGVVFSKDMRALVMYPAGRPGTGYTIPDGVKYVQGYAFSGSALESLLLPDSLMSINSDSCSGMGSLKEIDIPGKATYIGQCSFAQCKSLTKAVLQEGCLNIDWYAFCWCDNLETVTLPSTIETIDNDAFIGCDKLTIEGYDGSVAADFAAAHGIPFVSLGSGPEEPEDPYVTVGALGYELDLEDGTAKVLYAESDNAAKAVIPAAVEAYGRTFKVTEIGEEAFKGMKKLATVSIGKNVKEIGDRAFLNCAKLKKVTGMAGVTKIEDSAFQGCKVLTKIILPAKVKTIGAKAFYKCAKLKSITIRTTKLTTKNVGAKAFTGIAKKAKFTVPAKKLSAYKKLLVKKGAPKTATFTK